MGFRTPVKVRFSDVDKAGIVYYPRFFHFFHIAFEELFSERFGVPYVDVLTREGIGFPAVHAEIDFKAPLRYGDVADVEITVAAVGKKSITCRYRLLRQPSGTLCAEGEVVVATVDMERFTSLPIPERFRRFFEGELASPAARAPNATRPASRRSPPPRRRPRR